MPLGPAHTPPFVKLAGIQKLSARALGGARSRRRGGDDEAPGQRWCGSLSCTGARPASVRSDGQEAGSSPLWARRFAGSAVQVPRRQHLNQRQAEPSCRGARPAVRDGGHHKVGARAAGRRRPWPRRDQAFPRQVVRPDQRGGRQLVHEIQRQGACSCSRKSSRGWSR